MSAEPSAGVIKLIEDHRVQHLFLLLGLNPLPNYVAARLLLKPGGKFYLFHSQPKAATPRGPHAADAEPDRMAEARDTLIDRLADLGIKVADRISVSEADRDDIFKTVRDRAMALPRADSIGLHYTGGTKAMATHAYRALESVATEQNRTVVFSYLDARTLSLRIEKLDGKPAQAIPLFPWPAKAAIGNDGAPPTLEQLAALHGETLLPDKDPPDLLEAALELAQLCTNDQVAFALRTWLTKVVQPLQSSSWKHNNDGWLRETELEKKTLAWTFEPEGERGRLYRLMGAPRILLQRVFGQSDKTSFSLAQARDHLAKTHGRTILCSQICAWLDGVWLEQAVLDAVRQVADAAGIQEYRRGIETKPDPAVSHFPTKFEFDVAALRGYQLFGISCTTSIDRRTSRIKLLEAAMRTQQLGGEEARIGLVTFYAKPGDLRDELSQMFQRGTQIHIFGPRDLTRLPAALQEWFTAG